MKPLIWMRLVRDSDLPTAARVVAWAVGLRADQHGACFPSYERIAQDTGIHRRSAIRHIKQLADTGWLIPIGRCNGHGHQSNMYQLVDGRLWKTGGVVTQDHPLVTQDHPPGSDTGPPIRGIAQRSEDQTPPATVDNQATAALLNGMARQRRIPR